jgi:hypothetical protein
MFIAVTVPHNVGVAGDGGAGGGAGAGDIKYSVSPILNILPIDVLTLKFISTAAGAVELTLADALIPFKERSGYSAAPAGVVPVFLINANQPPSF